MFKTSQCEGWCVSNQLQHIPSPSLISQSLALLLSLSPDEKLLVSKQSAKLLNHIKQARNSKATSAYSTGEDGCSLHITGLQNNYGHIQNQETADEDGCGEARLTTISSFIQKKKCVNCNLAGDVCLDVQCIHEK